MHSPWPALIVGCLCCSCTLFATERFGDGADETGGAAGSATTAQGGGVSGNGGQAVGGASSGGNGGSGGMQGTGGTSVGGSPGDLVSVGLLARYFLDEADSGAAAGTVNDSSGNNAHLTITPSANMFWSNGAGGRGLQWAAPGLDGLASTTVGGTSLQTLNLAKNATFEIVTGPVGSMMSGVRMFHFGDDSDGDVAFSLNQISEPALRLQSENVAIFPGVDMLDGRKVYHYVVELDAPTNDAVRLYRDGVRENGTVDPQFVPAVMTINVSQDMVLGNRPTPVDRSPNGAIFYFAVYDRALTDMEITSNAGRLLISDDP